MKHTRTITIEDNKILLEGKIERDIREARRENSELTAYIFQNYPEAIPIEVEILCQ